jgi:hypothetical protein
MKKMLFSLLLIGAVTVAFATPPVNEKVMKQFQSVFPAVENARWFESDGHYDVYFEKENTKYQIRYDENGKILSTRNYYPGSKLCPFIKAKLNEKFADKSIFGVTEITNSNEMYYVIVLEDEDTWTNVQADAIGQLRTLTKMKKAK